MCLSNHVFVKAVLISIGEHSKVSHIGRDNHRDKDWGCKHSNVIFYITSVWSKSVGAKGELQGESQFEQDREYVHSECGNGTREVLPPTPLTLFFSTFFTNSLKF